MVRVPSAQRTIFFRLLPAKSSVSHCEKWIAKQRAIPLSPVRSMQEAGDILKKSLQQLLIRPLRLPVPVKIILPDNSGS